MNGIDPTLLPELSLKADVQEHPAVSITGFRDKLKALRDERYPDGTWERADRSLDQPLTSSFNYSDICTFIRRTDPGKVRALFSDEDMAAIAFSNVCSFSDRFEKLFEELPLILVLDKCSLSAWHNGYKKMGWDVAVAAYNGFRRFDLGVPGFTYKIDVTTGCNPRGNSRYTRTFLDGEMAIIIEYKGKHVITVGLDVTLSKEGAPRIFIRQIQLKQAKANRFLFALRPGYVECVTRACVDAFQGFEVFLIQGATAATSAADSYRTSIANARRGYTDVPLSERERQVIEGLTEKLRHVEEVVAPRLTKLYDVPFLALVRRTTVSNGYARVIRSTQTPAPCYVEQPALAC